MASKTSLKKILAKYELDTYVVNDLLTHIKNYKEHISVSKVKNIGDSIHLNISIEYDYDGEHCKFRFESEGRGVWSWNGEEGRDVPEDSDEDEDEDEDWFKRGRKCEGKCEGKCEDKYEAAPKQKDHQRKLLFAVCELLESNYAIVEFVIDNLYPKKDSAAKKAVKEYFSNSHIEPTVLDVDIDSKLVTDSIAQLKLNLQTIIPLNTTLDFCNTEQGCNLRLNVSSRWYIIMFKSAAFCLPILDCIDSATLKCIKMNNFGDDVKSKNMLELILSHKNTTAVEKLSFHGCTFPTIEHTPADLVVLPKLVISQSGNVGSIVDYLMCSRDIHNLTMSRMYNTETSGINFHRDIAALLKSPTLSKYFIKNCNELSDTELSILLDNLKYSYAHVKIIGTSFTNDGLVNFASALPRMFIGALTLENCKLAKLASLATFFQNLASSPTIKALHFAEDPVSDDVVRTMASSLNNGTIEKLCFDFEKEINVLLCDILHNNTTLCNLKISADIIPNTFKSRLFNNLSCPNLVSIRLYDRYINKDNGYCEVTNGLIKERTMLHPTLTHLDINGEIIKFN